MPSAPSKDLQRVPNPHVDRDYEVDHVVPEFTCMCPMTGQPDFATIRIRYVPDRWLVELKSLKLYMWAYRDEGAFHEDVTNRILADLVRTLAPRRMEVVGDWNVRGGIKTVVTVRYESPRGPGPARRSEGPRQPRRRRTAGHLAEERADARGRQPARLYDSATVTRSPISARMRPTRSHSVFGPTRTTALPSLWTRPAIAIPSS